MKRLYALLVTGALVVAACDGMGQAVSSHTNVLARAAGHELTIDEAATLVAPYRDIPATREVVDALANLWVDYMLLATAASQDSLLRNVNLEPILKPMREATVVEKLRDRNIHADTIITDDELRAEYEQEGIGLQVRARHILLRLAPDAPPAVRDSVTALARQLRERAVAGEDFAALARQYSQDGSAQQGGDLGFNTRGGWVAPFDEAAFALQPGEISDLVTTPYGLHIIKVEERRQTPFEEVRDQYRQRALERRFAEAESAYVTQLTDSLNIQVQEGAIENARELARSPGTELRGRAGSRQLVRYQGGGLTANEFREVIEVWPAQFRGQFAAASDDQLKQVLEGIARNKIIVAEAHNQGFGVSTEQADSMRARMQLELHGATSATGLTSIQPQDGETMAQAIERRVNSVLESILRSEQSPLPLGAISFSLRRQFGGEIFPRAFDAVAARIEAQRPPRPPAQQPPPPPPDSND